MKETRTINIGGRVFHIDYDAYQQLSSYLQDIELCLSSDERAEVMVDIEARISELLQNALFAKHVEVVDITMISAIQEQMGNPSEFGNNKRPKVRHTSAQHNGCGRVLAISMIVVLALLALPVVIPIIAIIAAILAAVFGMSVAMPFIGAELFGSSVGVTILLIITGVLVVVMPVIMLIHSIISWLRSRKKPSTRFWIITLSIWVLSIVSAIVLANHTASQLGGWSTLVQHVAAIDDDENEQTETRAVASYQNIVVNGIAQVRIYHADDFQTQVTSNRLPVVQTEVRDSTLYITVPDDRYLNATIDLYVPTITRVEGNAACEIEMMEQFTMDTLYVRLDGAGKGKFRINSLYVSATLNGAGQLNLEGESVYTDLHIAGAGKIESEWLRARILHINCAGASKAEVYAERELWAQATGASFITYKGHPTVKQQLAIGGSSIRKD